MSTLDLNNDINCNNVITFELTGKHSFVCVCLCIISS